MINRKMKRSASMNHLMSKFPKTKHRKMLNKIIRMISIKVSLIKNKILSKILSNKMINKTL
jgi:hypothetical protein